MSELTRLARLARSVMRPRPGDPAQAALPKREITRECIVDGDAYAAYCRVTGHRMGANLPVTYPHILSFKAVLQLFTEPQFPFSPAGMLHVSDQIVQYEPIPSDAAIHVRTRLDNLTPHRKGAVFDAVTEVLRGTRTVWSQNSTYLVRGRQTRDDLPAQSPQSVQLDTGDLEAVWPVPADTGRRYASVSGDFNPVHLNPVTARFFGMGRPIAHGMWSLARCMSALSGRVPEAARVNVRFRKPLRLPTAKVAFLTRNVDAAWHFGMAAPDGEKTYVSGVVASA